MSDEPVKECEVCGEPVKRLMFPVAIHFKGKGFYTTDYGRRNSLGAAGSHAANGGSESSSGSEGSGSADCATSPATKTSTPVPAASAAKSD